jgi:hypothetical protein
MPELEELTPEGWCKEGHGITREKLDGHNVWIPEHEQRNKLHLSMGTATPCGGRCPRGTSEGATQTDQNLSCCTDPQADDPVVATTV